jgi:hypothetical protein
MFFVVSILEVKPSSVYFLKYYMTPSICLRVACILTILDCNFLVTLFTENKMSRQISKRITNSKFSSALTKDWHSLTVIESWSTIDAFSSAIKDDLIWGV